MADRTTYYAAGGASTTTGTSYVTAASLTFTPEDGTYVYIASYEHANDNASNYEMFVQLWDGSAEVDLHNVAQDAADEKYAAAFIGRVTFSGSGELTWSIRHKNGTSGPTDEVAKCSILLIKLGTDDDYAEGTTTATLALSVPSDGDYLVLTYAALDYASSALVRLTEDSITKWSGTVDDRANGLDGAWSLAWVGSLAAGTQTLELTTDSAGTKSFVCAIRLDAFDFYDYTYDAFGGITTSTSAQTRATLNLAGLSTRDYVVLQALRLSAASAQERYGDVQHGGVTDWEIAYTPRLTSGSYVRTLLGAKVAELSGSESFSTRFWTSDSGFSASINYSSLVVFSVAELVPVTNYDASITETANASDGPAVEAELIGALSEDVAADDTLGVAMATTLPISEAVDAADGDGTLAGLTGALSESAQADESWAWTGSVLLSESVEVSETWGVLLTAAPAITESGEASETQYSLQGEVSLLEAAEAGESWGVTLESAVLGLGDTVEARDLLRLYADREPTYIGVAELERAPAYVVESNRVVYLDSELMQEVVGTAIIGS